VRASAVRSLSRQWTQLVERFSAYSAGRKRGEVFTDAGISIRGRGERLIRAKRIRGDVQAPLQVSQVVREANKKPSKRHRLKGFLLVSAVRTGLEPATSSVTGWHSNQLNYRTSILNDRLSIYGLPAAVFNLLVITVDAFTISWQSVWSGRDLNPRHMDFQSIALPTELPDRRVERQYTENPVPRSTTNGPAVPGVQHVLPRVRIFN
jgi:hypothetical protein